jgi:hypothetical protein
MSPSGLAPLLRPSVSTSPEHNGSDVTDNMKLATNSPKLGNSPKVLGQISKNNHIDNNVEFNLEDAGKISNQFNERNCNGSPESPSMMNEGIGHGYGSPAVHHTGPDKRHLGDPQFKLDLKQGPGCESESSGKIIFEFTYGLFILFPIIFLLKKKCSDIYTIMYLYKYLCILIYAYL